MHIGGAFASPWLGRTPNGVTGGICPKHVVYFHTNAEKTNDSKAGAMVTNVRGTVVNRNKMRRIDHQQYKESESVDKDSV